MILCRAAAVAVFLSIPASCWSQEAMYRLVLKAQLDSIGYADQQYRSLADGLSTASADSLGKAYSIPADSVYSHLMYLQSFVDSTNIEAVARIIKQYGYPGKSLVGADRSQVAFYVIQHSSRIKLYLPLLQRAARAKELSPTLVAMMEDRQLTEDQQEQIYGTQLWGNPVKDPVTGIAKPHFYFNPIRNARSVNRRRRKAGFTETIEEYAAGLGVSYEIRRPWWWKK
jgi:hypothetical protein